jgi:hypothetical protein
MDDAWKAADAFLLQRVSLIFISTDEENSCCADTNGQDWSEYIKELSSMHLELVSYMGVSMENSYPFNS